MLLDEVRGVVVRVVWGLGVLSVCEIRAGVAVRVSDQSRVYWALSLMKCGQTPDAGDKKECTV